jgi:phosphopantothenoylcysteine decarboxylase/phosphopantothenate--cysteine ligase
MGKRVILGVTGSIAAFKAAALASDLVQAGHEVQVVLTPGGARFISALTFEAITGRPVPAEVWDEAGGRSGIGHVELGRWTDLLAVAPASAGAIARLALGLPADMLGAIALSTASPVIVAPAMETGMWEHPATREHIETLRRRGVTVVGPTSGRLASGVRGSGRMSEPEEIMAEIERLLAGSRELAGVQVMVSAGPTYEPIDPVRFIGNRSSGKMGYAVAEEARDRGAHVVLVSGPSAVPPPGGLEVVRVETHGQMRQAVLDRAGSADVVVMAAAIADFTPSHPAEIKIKREDAMTLHLHPTSDIAAEVAAAHPEVFLIGFALETGDLVERAREKMRRKGLGMVVANAVNASHNPFGSDDNRVTLVTPEGTVEIQESPKRVVAREIWDAALRLRPSLRSEHRSHQ